MDRVRASQVLLTLTAQVQSRSKRASLFCVTLTRSGQDKNPLGFLYRFYNYGKAKLDRRVAGNSVGVVFSETTVGDRKTIALLYPRLALCTHRRKNIAISFRLPVRF